MQADLAAVHAGKEIAPQDEHQTARQHAKSEKGSRELTAPFEHRRENDRVAAPNLLETRVECTIHALQQAGAGIRPSLGRCMIHEQHHQGGHQRTRQDVRGQHCEHHGLGQRREQIPRHAGEKEHRHEHDADAQSGDQGRNSDLTRAFQNGLVQIRAHVHVALDVLDGHRGIVDQDAHRQRQAAERHDVQRFPQDVERNDRGQDRQGNRDGDDAGAAPVAQEHEDERGRETRGDQGLAYHAADGSPDEARLVEQRHDLQILGQGLRHDRQLREQGFDDVQGRRTAVLDDGHENAALAVLTHDIGLRREPVAHVRHFGQIRGRAVAGQHRHIVEPGDGIWGTVGGEYELGGPDLGGAGGQYEILGVDRIDHVVRRQALGEQRVGIEIDRNHPRLSAVGVGNGHPRDGDETRAQKIRGGIEHRLFGHGGTGQPQLNDGDAGCGVFEDLRRQDAGRQLAQLRLLGGDHLCDGRRYIGVRLKENLDDGEPG